MSKTEMGVWISVAELARRKGITRQAAHERIARLEADGALSSVRRGRKKLIELATFDFVTGQHLADETSKPSVEPIARRDAQADRALYEAKLKALDYAERTGQVVPINGSHGVETAMINIVEKIVQDLQRPLEWVHEIMDASRHGEKAIRCVLRDRIHEQRLSIVSHLAELVEDAQAIEAAGYDIDFEDAADVNRD